MKKLLSIALLAGSLLINSAFCYVPVYPDWVWSNGVWVYTGTNPNPPPPPPPIRV